MKADLAYLLRCGLLCAGLAAGVAWGHGGAGDASSPSGRPVGPDTPSLQDGKENMQGDKQPSKKSTRQIPSRQTADPDQRAGGAAGVGARDSKSPPGGATGSTGHGGMPGSGASSGSGGTPGMRD